MTSNWFTNQANRMQHKCILHSGLVKIKVLIYILCRIYLLQDWGGHCEAHRSAISSIHTPKQSPSWQTLTENDEEKNVMI